MSEKLKTISTIIGIVLLLLAILSGFWPYGYYILLRWLITGLAIYLLYLASENEQTGWLITMGIIALLFNPIIPFYLGKETWVVVDLIVAVIFGISIFKIKEPINL